MAHVLGKVNDGWTPAIVALGNERANLGTGMYVIFKRNLDALIDRARSTRRHGRPLIDDPVVRQKLAQADLELEVFRLNTLRSLSRMSKTGTAGPEGSIQKLYWSEMNQRMAQIALEVLGPEAQQWDFDTAAGPTTTCVTRQHHRGGHQRSAAQHPRPAGPRPGPKLLKS